MELDAALGNLRLVQLAIILLAVSPSHAVLEEKVCNGTNTGFLEPTSHETHYGEIKDRYTGCTFVQGNLELTWLRSGDLDLSFLSNIREVSGYVLLFNVGVRRIPVTSLQIIRGEKLMKTKGQREGFAFLASNVTTEYLEMPALGEIQRGCVGFLQSYNLCHIKAIEWKSINQDWASNVFDITNTETECSPCDASCNGRCWGPGIHNCQMTNTLKCHSECSGRCFGEGYTDCCHSYCAVGCNGTQPNNCIACKHYNNEGTCVVSCPKGKFKYGATCVMKCPHPMLKDNDACVPVCPPGKRVTEGACIPCEGPCSKWCEGVDVIHSGNVGNFQNCTTILGSLEIRNISFDGFLDIHPFYGPGQRYKKMHPDALEVLSTVKEIRGYLTIEATYSSFKDLSFFRINTYLNYAFRSLEVIQGSILSENQAALTIENTSLKTLGLRSLRTVSRGSIIIRENKDLCLLKQRDWNEIKSSPIHSLQIQGNRPEYECVQEGLRCPGLKSSRLNMECFLASGEPHPCDQPAPEGTIATYGCRQFYVSNANHPNRGSVCLNGTWSAELLHCVPECGKAMGEVNPLVVNGTAAKYGEWPWQVALYVRFWGKHGGPITWDFQCGGSLVAENIVLTAAHCVWGVDTDAMVAAIGKYYRDYSRRQELTQMKELKEIIMNPSYLDKQGNYDSDIALLVLISPVLITAVSKPVCLDWDELRENVDLSPPSIGTVVGWGVTENDIPSETPRKANLPVINFNQCVKALPRDFGKYLRSTTFCAGYLNRTSVCNGDSGGGLMFQKDDGSWVLQGVVSVSPRRMDISLCDPRYYAIFTRVSKYIKWAITILVKHAPVP